MSNERERVISITLSEAEWQAFVARQPEPVLYLREKIRDVVREPEQPEESARELRFLSRLSTCRAEARSNRSVPRRARSSRRPYAPDSFRRSNVPPGARQSP